MTKDCLTCEHLDEFGYGSCCHPIPVKNNDSKWHIEECYKKNFKHWKEKS